MPSRDPQNIVIIGGGIIGASSSFFLATHPSFNRTTTTLTLLEASSIAGGASGKAGGLLALWAYPKPLVPLSYRLHKELAERYDGERRWGYRAVHVGQVEARGRRGKGDGGPAVKGREDRATGKGDGGAVNPDERVSLRKRSGEAMARLKAAGIPEDLDWVAPESVVAYESMGDPTTTAQVHPYLFTKAMVELAEEKGLRVVYGSATAINQEGGEVRSVSYTDKETGEAKELVADTVVLSAGPWTQQVWPSAPISALRAHSVTIRPSRPVSAYALFTQISLPAGPGTRRGETVSPEIYARPNNEVYACGEGDHLVPLPATTELVPVDEQRCQDIVDQVASISDELRDGEVTARQACYLPNVSSGGGPLIGETGVKGLIMAAGHTCWGIQNGPGTGKLVSEFVFDGAAKSAKIGALDPRAFL